MLHPALFRMRVHLLGAASSLGCAYFGLKQLALDSEAHYGADVANFLRSNIYVDDGLKNVKSVGSAVDMIQKCQAICRDGGLRLHKFASNSNDVLANIPPEDLANGLTGIDFFCESVGHLTRKSGVLGSIPDLATYFRFSFRFFKKGSCQLLAKVCACSTG